MSADLRLRLSGRVLPLVAIVLACGVGTAVAQVGQEGMPNRPYQGLFGGNNGAAGRSQGLDLNGSLFAGYDDNVLAGSGGIGNNSGFQESGPLFGASLGLGYFRNSGRSSFQVSTGTGARYYPTLDEPMAPNAWAHAGWSRALGPRTQWSLSGGFRYYPYYDYGLIPTVSSSLSQAEASALGPTAPVTDNGDLAVIDQQLYQSYVGTSVNHRVTARSTFSASYAFSRTYFTDTDGGDSTYHRAGAGYRYALTQDLGLRAGYYFSRRFYTDRDPQDIHDIDAGVDYNKGFQFGSQRTNFRFSVGSAMFVRQRVDEGDPDGESFYATAVGSAHFYHRISREWFTTAVYERGIRYVEGYPDPVLQDLVGAQLAGYLNQRLDVVVGASYAGGSKSLNKQDYRTGAASARLQYALWQNMAAYAQYFYYYYDYDDDFVLPSGYPPQQERQGFRAGLSFWVPLMR